MYRKPRIHYPGALYHVMLRGHSGEPVFFDGSDRCRFYLLLPEGAGRYGWVFDLCAESGRSALGNAGSGQISSWRHAVVRCNGWF